MNAEIQKVPSSFKVVKWGVPADKLDQLAELLGLEQCPEGRTEEWWRRRGCAGSAAVLTPQPLDQPSAAVRLKRSSALRRVPASQAMRLTERNGLEGDICVFELAFDAAALDIEAVTGRALVIAPGDRFLATAGYRESTRWVVGHHAADGGLVPGSDYWVLAACGVVGEFVGKSPREKGHLGQVRFLGTMCDEDGATLNIRQFAQCQALRVGR